MGSAAPSLRRWLSTLALSVGVLVAALALVVAVTPLQLPFGAAGRFGEPGDAASDAREDLGAEPTVVDWEALGVRTATVAFEPGWRVPPLAHDRAEPGEGDRAHGHPPPGSATTGGTLALPDDVAAVVIRPGPAGQLAVRFGPEQASALGPGGRVPAEGQWIELAAVLDEGPDGLPGAEGGRSGSPSAAPLLVPEGADRLELVAVDGVPETVELVLLPRFDQPSTDGPASPIVVDGGPAIVPREAWANIDWAEDHAGCGPTPTEADHLQAVVVHHTVTANDYSPEEVGAILRSILYSHTQVNGWCDIGYNFVVDRFGRIWEARTGSIESKIIGGHARGFNTGTLGIAVLGQHHEPSRPPAVAVPAAVVDSVVELANWKLDDAGVDPTGTTWLRNRSSGGRQRLAAESWHLVPTVLGHRDLGLTSCPGSHGMSIVEALRARLVTGIGTDPPYDLVGWSPHGHGPAFAVVDDRGGLRPAGSAAPWSPAPAPADTADPVVAIGGGPDGGYLLTASGGLRVYGAPAAPGVVPTSGGAVDLAVRSDRSGGWVLDGSGLLRGFGTAGDLVPDGGPVPDPVAVSLSDSGQGHVLDRSGRLHPVGGVADRGLLVPTGDVVDLDLRDPDAGWILDRNGRLTGFGGTADARVVTATAPVAVVAGAPDTGGWVVDATGQFHPFGGARYVLPAATGADTVDADRVAQVVDQEFLDSDDARFIVGLHRLFRAPDPNPSTIDLQVTALEQGRDRYDLALPLARSEAWTGAEVDRMYLDVLGRPADPAGRRYWLDQIAAGLDLAEVGTYFYGSEEYARASGEPADYVAQLYRALLGRMADAEGLAYWTEVLASGRGKPPDVASGFYASIESRRSRSARLHLEVLGVAPPPSERDSMAERLGSVGDAAFAAELAADSAFYRRVVDGSGP